MQKLMRGSTVLLLIALTVAATYPIGTKLGGRLGYGFVIECYDANIDGSAELLSENTGMSYAQISAAEAVEIYSSSSADITQVVTVGGIDNTSGAYVIESETLTGVTPVATTTVFRYVDQMWSDAECAGTVWARKATGDVAIIEMTIGSVKANVAQHFSGTKVSYVQKWWATNVLGTDEVLLELRWYPDDADSLDAGDGFMVLDRIHLIAGADSPAPHDFTDYPNGGLRCPAGGWLAVYGTGASADEGASVTVVGFDANR